MQSMRVSDRAATPKPVRPRLLSAPLSPLPRAADCGRLELFLAGATAEPLLALDRAAAGVPPDSRRECQCGRRRADPLVAEPSAACSTRRAGRPAADLQLRR